MNKLISIIALSMMALLCSFSSLASSEQIVVNTTEQNIVSTTDGSVATTNTKKADAVDKYEEIVITVNINTATEAELAMLLIGVGEKKARDIIEYRTKNGPFMTIDDLSRVKGIGKETLEKNRTRIQL